MLPQHDRRLGFYLVGPVRALGIPKTGGVQTGNPPSYSTSQPYHLTTEPL